MVQYMNWYQKSQASSSDQGSITKSASTENKLTKNAAEITQEFGHISSERWEDFIYITATRVHETSYYIQVTCREFDNKIKDPFWITVITAFSFESGNIVYKKCIYHKSKKTAQEDYKKVLDILNKLAQEQESNSLPTASFPNMIWHSLHDVDGDKDIKPKASGNIIYLKQNHNINENKGNLFKNILYLDKANTEILEKDPYGTFHEQEGMF